MQMTVSSGEKAALSWLRPILSTTFDGLCVTHDSKEHNYCIDCKAALCDKCKMQPVPSKQHKMQHVPSEHKMIRAYKIRESMSFRMEDLELLWDISGIRPYIFNEHPVTYVHKRGHMAPSHGQSGLGKCESCQYSFKSQGAKYCSLECKVEAVRESVKKQPRKQKNPQRAPR